MDRAYLEEFWEHELGIQMGNTQGSNSHTVRAHQVATGIFLGVSGVGERVILPCVGVVPLMRSLPFDELRLSYSYFYPTSVGSTGKRHSPTVILLED